MCRTVLERTNSGITHSPAGSSCLHRMQHFSCQPHPPCTHPGVWHRLPPRAVSIPCPVHFCRQAGLPVSMHLLFRPGPNQTVYQNPNRLNPLPKSRLQQAFRCSRPTVDRMKTIMPLWPCPALDPQQYLARSSTSNQRQPLAATAFPGLLGPVLVYIFKTCPVHCPSAHSLLCSYPRAQCPSSQHPRDHSPRLSSGVDLSSDRLSFPLLVQQQLKPQENQLKRGKPTRKTSQS